MYTEKKSWEINIGTVRPMNEAPLKNLPFHFKNLFLGCKLHVSPVVLCYSNVLIIMLHLNEPNVQIYFINTFFLIFSCFHPDPGAPQPAGHRPDHRDALHKEGRPRLQLGQLRRHDRTLLEAGQV